MDPPSLRLPPLRGLPTLPISTLLHCIEYLAVLYTPLIRGSRILRRLGREYRPQNIDDYDSKLATLRADSFERAYALRWLAYLVNNAQLIPSDAVDAETVIARAAALLANCSGVASAGIVTRVLSFPSPVPEDRTPLRISLRDLPLENADFASVGAQTWGGACVLAELIATEPQLFRLLSHATSAPLRVLELGAGTGLAGLAFAKTAERLGHSVEVVCSDVYPSVLLNLGVNIAANFPPLSTAANSVSISAHALDYSASASSTSFNAPPFDTPFDIILGADIIYEPPHAGWLRSCVARLLATPAPPSLRRDHAPLNADDDGVGAAQFHLVIPLRPTHALESRSVEEAFAPSSSSATEHAQKELGIQAKEMIVCGEGVGEEEIEYAYYRIGWV